MTGSGLMLKISMVESWRNRSGYSDTSCEKLAWKKRRRVDYIRAKTWYKNIKEWAMLERGGGRKGERARERENGRESEVIISANG